MTTQHDPGDPPVLEGVDLERPNVARVYDWFLGGTANWAVDREFGSQVLELFPEVKTFARVGRDFLGCGVGYLARQGITQFLDIGSGVPTVGNVHQIAGAINPDTRVVYLDIEPVAVAHSQLLLEREGLLGRHAVLQGDVRDPADIWKRALGTGVLDPRQPIGLVLVGLLYFLGPDEPVHEMVRHYIELLPSGSYFLSSHLTEDGVTRKEGDNRENVQELYKKDERAVPPAQPRGVRVVLRRPGDGGAGHRLDGRLASGRSGFAREHRVRRRPDLHRWARRPGPQALSPPEVRPGRSGGSARTDLRTAVRS